MLEVSVLHSTVVSSSYLCRDQICGSLTHHARTTVDFYHGTLGPGSHRPHLFGLSGVGDGSSLQAITVDNGQQVYSFNGPIGSGVLFYFNSIAINSAALANPAGDIQYFDLSGHYVLEATQGVANQRSACRIGCGEDQCCSTDQHTGDNITDYGILKPSDVITHLTNICKSGLTTVYNTGNQMLPLTLTPLVDGDHDSANPAMLDAVIAAVQSMASTGWTKETVDLADNLQEQGVVALVLTSDPHGICTNVQLSSA